MDALESVRDAGVAVSGIVVDGYYGIGDVVDTITSEEFWDLTEKPDEESCNGFLCGIKISPSIGITASKNVSLSVLFFSTSSPIFVNSASSHCS
jgi:hypothetical protein